jgi:hypothetical protein
MPQIDAELLRRSIHENMDSARAQIERSQQIVTHARELIERVKLSLAHSQRIHNEMAGHGNRVIRRDDLRRD